MTITNPNQNQKLSNPVLTTAEGERAKQAQAQAKAAPKAAPKAAAPKAASATKDAPKAANAFSAHEEAAEKAISSGLADVTGEEVRRVVDTARASATAAYMANLPGNALAALAKDQSRKQKSFCDKTSIAFLLSKI